MNLYWKLGIVASYTLFIALAVHHWDTISAQAANEQAVIAEKAKHDSDQQAANDHAADLEKELAAERQKSIVLNSQLEIAYEKVTNNCSVPVDLIRLRNTALSQ